jgi:hypothetical protein
MCQIPEAEVPIPEVNVPIPEASLRNLQVANVPNSGGRESSLICLIVVQAKLELLPVEPCQKRMALRFMRLGRYR